jgi:cold shock CspA family protein
MVQKMKGVIASYIRHRGFGFLTNDADVHELVFFHISAWKHARAPEIGAAVNYDCCEGKSDKGPQARNVQLANAQTLSSPAEVLAEPAVTAEKAQASTEVD